MNEKRKDSKIIGELNMFLLSHDYHNYKIEINYNPNKIIIKIIIDYIKEEDLEYLLKELNTRRNESYEEYGWEALCENDGFNGLYCIGLLVDDCTYEIRDNKYIITIERMII